MNRIRPQEIITRRLCLHAFLTEDADDMIAMLTDSDISKTYMLPDFPTREDAMKMFETFARLSENEERFVYGIYLNSRLIGFINEVEKTEDAIELGFVISTAHHNCGYAAETLEACMHALFDMGYDTVKTGAFEENGASVRVMEKCGMTRLEKTETITYRGKDHRCILFEKKRG